MTGSLAVDGTARVSSDTVIGGTNNEGYRLKIESSGASVLRLLRTGLLGANFTFNSSNALTISGCSVDINSGLSIGIGTSAFVPSSGFLYVANGATIGQGSTINASAVLDVASTGKGFLPPRMTLVQRTGISSPASGLIVYETGSAPTEGIWVYESTGWQQVLTNTGSLNISGSVTAASFTGSLLGTASFANNATSASFATTATTAATASYATNLTVASTLTLDATLTDYASVASSIVGSNNLFTQNTGSYTSAFFKYTARNGSNTRAGEVISAWNGITTTFTDFSTVDIGDTSAVTASISIVSGQAQFNVQTNSSGWSIKSIGTFM
jgi:hypothetical protein